MGSPFPWILASPPSPIALISRKRNRRLMPLQTPGSPSRSKRTPLPGAAELLKETETLTLVLRMPQKTKKDRILSNFIKTGGDPEPYLSKPRGSYDPKYQARRAHSQAGHRQLGIEAKQWDAIAGAIASALPHGVTTAICDPHEISNVLGLVGLHYFLEAAQNTVLDLRVQLSSCVPSTHLETSGASCWPLTWSRCATIPR